MIRPHTCPVCEKKLPPGAADESVFPFCSVRCRQVDLFRWLTGKYAVVEPLDAEQLAREAESGEADDAGEGEGHG